MSNLTVTITLNDALSPGLAAAARNAQTFASQMGNINRTMGSNMNNITQAGSLISSAFGMTLGKQGTQGSIFSSIEKEATSFFKRYKEGLEGVARSNKSLATTFQGLDKVVAGTFQSNLKKVKDFEVATKSLNQHLDKMQTALRNTLGQQGRPIWAKESDYKFKMDSRGQMVAEATRIRQSDQYVWRDIKSIDYNPLQAIKELYRQLQAGGYTQAQKRVLMQQASVAQAIYSKLGGEPYRPAIPKSWQQIQDYGTTYAETARTVQAARNIGKAAFAEIGTSGFGAYGQFAFGSLRGTGGQLGSGFSNMRGQLGAARRNLEAEMGRPLSDFEWSQMVGAYGQVTPQTVRYMRAGDSMSRALQNRGIGTDEWAQIGSANIAQGSKYMKLAQSYAAQGDVTRAMNAYQQGIGQYYQGRGAGVIPPSYVSGQAIRAEAQVGKGMYLSADYGNFQRLQNLRRTYARGAVESAEAGDYGLASMFREKGLATGQVMSVAGRAAGSTAVVPYMPSSMFLGAVAGAPSMPGQFGDMENIVRKQGGLIELANQQASAGNMRGAQAILSMAFAYNKAGGILQREMGTAGVPMAMPAAVPGMGYYQQSALSGMGRFFGSSLLGGRGGGNWLTQGVNPATQWSPSGQFRHSWFMLMPAAAAISYAARAGMQNVVDYSAHDVEVMNMMQKSLGGTDKWGMAQTGNPMIRRGLQWIKDYAGDSIYPQTQMKEFLGKVYAFGKGINLKDESAWRFGKSIVSRTADVISVKDIPTDETMASVLGAISGRPQGLAKSAGIFLQENLVKPWAVQQGYVSSEKEFGKLPKNKKVYLAAQKYLYDTAWMAGDMPQTMSQYANMRRRAGASMQDFMREVGYVTLPSMKGLAATASELGIKGEKWFSGLDVGTKKQIVGAGFGTAAAVPASVGLLYSSLVAQSFKSLLPNATNLPSALLGIGKMGLSGAGLGAALYLAGSNWNRGLNLRVPVEAAGGALKGVGSYLYGGLEAMGETGLGQTLGIGGATKGINWLIEKVSRYSKTEQGVSFKDQWEDQKKQTETLDNIYKVNKKQFEVTDKQWNSMDALKKRLLAQSVYSREVGGTRYATELGGLNAIELAAIGFDEQSIKRAGAQSAVYKFAGDKLLPTLAKQSIATMSRDKMISTLVAVGGGKMANLEKMSDNNLKTALLSDKIIDKVGVRAFQALNTEEQQRQLLGTYGTQRRYGQGKYIAGATPELRQALTELYGRDVVTEIGKPSGSRGAAWALGLGTAGVMGYQGLKGITKLVYDTGMKNNMLGGAWGAGGMAASGWGGRYKNLLDFTLNDPAMQNLKLAADSGNVVAAEQMVAAQKSFGAQRILNNLGMGNYSEGRFATGMGRFLGIAPSSVMLGSTVALGTAALGTGLVLGNELQLARARFGAGSWGNPAQVGAHPTLWGGLAQPSWNPLRDVETGGYFAAPPLGASPAAQEAFWSGRKGYGGSGGFWSNLWNMPGEAVGYNLSGAYSNNLYDVQDALAQKSGKGFKQTVKMSSDLDTTKARKKAADFQSEISNKPAKFTAHLDVSDARSTWQKFRDWITGQPPVYLNVVTNMTGTNTGNVSGHAPGSKVKKPYIASEPRNYRTKKGYSDDVKFGSLIVEQISKSGNADLLTSEFVGGTTPASSGGKAKKGSAHKVGSAAKELAKAKKNYQRQVSDLLWDISNYALGETYGLGQFGGAVSTKLGDVSGSSLNKYGRYGDLYGVEPSAIMDMSIGQVGGMWDFFAQQEQFRDSVRAVKVEKGSAWAGLYDQSEIMKRGHMKTRAGVLSRLAKLTSPLDIQMKELGDAQSDSKQAANAIKNAQLKEGVSKEILDALKEYKDLCDKQVAEGNKHYQLMTQASDAYKAFNIKLSAMGNYWGNVLGTSTYGLMGTVAQKRGSNSFSKFMMGELGLTGKEMDMYSQVQGNTANLLQYWEQQWGQDQGKNRFQMQYRKNYEGYVKNRSNALQPWLDKSQAKGTRYDKLGQLIELEMANPQDNSADKIKKWKEEQVQLQVEMQKLDKKIQDVNSAYDKELVALKDHEKALYDSSIALMAVQKQVTKGIGIGNQMAFSIGKKQFPEWAGQFVTETLTGNLNNTFAKFLTGEDTHTGKGGALSGGLKGLNKGISSAVHGLFKEPKSTHQKSKYAKLAKGFIEETFGIKSTSKGSEGWGFTPWNSETGESGKTQSIGNIATAAVGHVAGNALGTMLGSVAGGLLSGGIGLLAGGAVTSLFRGIFGGKHRDTAPLRPVDVNVVNIGDITGKSLDVSRFEQIRDRSYNIGQMDKRLTRSMTRIGA